MDGPWPMYGLVGTHGRDLLTYRGRPIVHTSRHEIEWLLPQVRVVAVTEADLRKASPLRPLLLKDHPDLASTRWPLRKEDFRDGR